MSSCHPDINCHVMYIEESIFPLKYSLLLYCKFIQYIVNLETLSVFDCLHGSIPISSFL